MVVEGTDEPPIPEGDGSTSSDVGTESSNVEDGTVDDGIVYDDGTVEQMDGATATIYF